MLAGEEAKELGRGGLLLVERNEQSESKVARMTEAKRTANWCREVDAEAEGGSAAAVITVLAAESLELYRSKSVPPDQFFILDRHYLW